MLFRRRPAGPARQDETAVDRGRAPARRPGHRSPVGRPAPPVTGPDPSGSPVAFDVTGGRRVVLFLTSTCQSCRGLWPVLAETAGALPAGGLAVVTPGPSTESRRRVAALAPGGLTVVMSGDTWLDWSPGPAPWAVVVDDGVGTWEGPAPGDREGLLRLLQG